MSACFKVVRQALIGPSLLLPLQHLALKAFSSASADGGPLALPPNFVHKWRDMLRPLCELAGTFDGAFRALAEREQAAKQPGSAAPVSRLMEEDELYRFDLGAVWWHVPELAAVVDAVDENACSADGNQRMPHAKDPPCGASPKPKRRCTRG